VGRDPPSGAPLLSRRIFSAGATHNLSTTSGAWLPARDFIAPGTTNLYRIGCETVALDAENLATNPGMEAPALSQVGFRQAGYGEGSPLVTSLSDTAVAKDGRHSAKINVPDGTPLVLSIPGRNLGSSPAGARWGAHNPPPAGSRIHGNGVVLAAGKTYSVSLAVQVRDTLVTIF
jgi:hypothetical protein